MKFLIFGFLFTCAYLKSASGDVNELSKATAKLALAMLKASGNSDKSTIFSPASILVCVGMAYAGAANNTKSQINKALYNGLSDNKIKEQMKNLSDILNQPTPAYNLSLANRLYSQKRFEILKPYLNTLKTVYSSEFKSVDFISHAEAVRQEINGWVENKTNAKIKDLIPPDSLNGVVLALINAIYFKGDWSHKFNETWTSEKTFYSAGNSQVQVDMMTQRSTKFYYNENDKVQVLGLPYTNDELAMYIILPKQINDLNELESKLTGDKLMDLIHKAKEREAAEVQIPKFKLEQSYSSNDLMQKLGMTDMFDPSKADFSGIDGKTDLVVSAVIHKAFIEVNEKGTEAAAATAIIFELTSESDDPPPPRFIANHSFLFAIVDRRIWNPLFFGRYTGK